MDLTVPLGPDEARAGKLAAGDAGAFVGGAAGEAQAGDYLLYNDRARFVVRGLREGHFYVGMPGSLIVAEFPSLAAATAWAEADPYVAASVYEQVTVQPFKKVFPR